MSPEVVQSVPKAVPEAFQPSQEILHSQIPVPSVTNHFLSHPHWDSVDTSLPLAGRVAHCLENWKQLTSDPWILQVAQGYQINSLPGVPSSNISNFQASSLASRRGG